MKSADVSTVRAIKDDLVACGDTVFRLGHPIVRLDIEEEGDFSTVDEDLEEESTFLEMASAAVQSAHARMCILQGYSPSALPGESARLTRVQHILATEQLDPPMTDVERRCRNDQFMCEDDSSWLERQADMSEAWNRRHESFSDVLR
jgi:hypothetical protein